MQAEYMRQLASREMIFALGPAGTGKTYLAVAQAVSQLISGSVQRLILSRPAVEAGERLGFLPGDMKEKVDPYMQPLYDALNDFFPPKQVAKLIEERQIEIAPLEKGGRQRRQQPRLQQIDRGPLLRRPSALSGVAGRRG